MTNRPTKKTIWTVEYTYYRHINHNFKTIKAVKHIEARTVLDVLAKSETFEPKCQPGFITSIQKTVVFDVDEENLNPIE